jgi:hypothetical protein
MWKPSSANRLKMIMPGEGRQGGLTWRLPAAGGWGEETLAIGNEDSLLAPDAVADT